MHSVLQKMEQKNDKLTDTIAEMKHQQELNASLSTRLSDMQDQFEEQRDTMGDLQGQLTLSRRETEAARAQYTQAHQVRTGLWLYKVAIHSPVPPLPSLLPLLCPC